jgi:superfamily II DNA/RNA helicase
MSQDNAQLRDIYKYTSLTLNGVKLKINRQEDKILLMTTFESSIPLYAEDNKNASTDTNANPDNKCGDMYLTLDSYQSKKVINLKLSNFLTQQLIMKDCDNLSDSDYLIEFCERKKKFITEILITNMYKDGFTDPSIVQSISVPELIQKKDALIMFNSGTGKTHAFLFGCLWNFDIDNKKLQYIFITSSHEVAIQILEKCKEILIYDDDSKKVKIELCIGKGPAASKGFQERVSYFAEKIRMEGAQIIVCTMGKLYDYLFTKKFNIDLPNIKSICVDEFDIIVAPPQRQSQNIIIDNGEEIDISSSSGQLKMIIKKLSKNTQRVFYSATSKDECLNAAREHFRPDATMPLVILLENESLTIPGIKQYYGLYEYPEDKDAMLKDILGKINFNIIIIFVNNKKTPSRISRDLEKCGHNSIIFHGNMSRSERECVFEQFANGFCRIMISTDIMSRGIDISGISHVINYDMPNSLETYIHRIGRSGRFGKKGIAISLVAKNDDEKIRQINQCSPNNTMISFFD